MMMAENNTLRTMMAPIPMPHTQSPLQAADDADATTSAVAVEKNDDQLPPVPVSSAAASLVANNNNVDHPQSQQSSPFPYFLPPSPAANTAGASPSFNHSHSSTLPSASPNRINLANSSNSLGGTNSSNIDESLTNFMKYGSIRPPISVLQGEFNDMYARWREHAEPLDGIDNLSNGRESSGDLWTGHMASIQTLYARYHNKNQSTPTAGVGVAAATGGVAGPQLYDHNMSMNNNGTFYNSQPLSSSGLCEQKCCEDASAASDEEKADECGNKIESNNLTGEEEDYNERRQLQELATLMFRPGSKLAGTIETIQQQDSAQYNAHPRSSSYELVVMEGDMLDEAGEPRGVLARHKFAGDEQCVFVKLSFVSVSGVESVGEEEEKQSVEDDEEEAKVKSNEDGNSYRNKKLDEDQSSEHKVTIQMEYQDGDHLIQGVWNHGALCFEGTVTKLSESQGDSNQMGGTIISGLISGHSSYGDGSSSDELPSSERNVISRRSTPNAGTRSFTLSPCTHLHPRGISPAPLYLALTETLSRMGLLSIQPEVNSSTGGGDGTAAKAVTTKARKQKPMAAEKQKKLLDEIASHDNYKLVLHRARTDRLRRETLSKLVELGSVLDFADLARKRNVAKRREKWRGRMRKYTPRLPHRLLHRGGRTSTTTTTSSGDDKYDLSKDNVQKKKVQFYDQLAIISWGDLLEEAAVQAEKTCANFRRQTALLNGTTFESDEYKAQVMADLRANGLTLATSHSDWDKCIQMGRTIALGWSWFERGSWSCFERSAVVGKRCVFLLFQMHSRLESNHKHLEKAFRSADARLTNVQLNLIKNGSHAAKTTGKSEAGQGDESDGLCGICQCDMGSDEENKQESNHAVCLPCSHTFHWECIREWLHDHSQCPICRVDLNES